MKREQYECEVCRKMFSRTDSVSAQAVRDSVSVLIRNDFPNWSGDSYICRGDLSAYRAKYVHLLLESDKGELSEIEKEVLDSLQKQAIISSNVDDEFEQDWTFGEKLADRIAAFGGSWRFLIVFAAFLFVWITINSLVLLWRPVDPYPFILLNLVLSCLAAIQAPVIMMSQNRQEAKDRVRAQHDYQVNLKAELEIRQIHEKLDHLLNKQWERLVQIQEIQMEQLSEINELKQKKPKRSP
jgi:uncharacterized membrane protein